MKFLKRLFGLKSASHDLSIHGGQAMISLVVLSSSWSELSVDSLRASLDTLFPGNFLPPREIANFVVETKEQQRQFLIQCSVEAYSGMFMLLNVPYPYSNVSDFLAHIQDPEIRELAAQQTCWLSVDLIHRHATDQDAYRFIGALLAQLAPSDAAVLVHPTNYKTVLLTPEIRNQLAKGLFSHAK